MKLTRGSSDQGGGLATLGVMVAPTNESNALRASFIMVATLLETRVHSGTLLPQITTVGRAMLSQAVTAEAGQCRGEGGRAEAGLSSVHSLLFL